MRVKTFDLQAIIDELFEHGLFSLWVLDGL